MSERLRESNEREVERQGGNYGSKNSKSESVKENTRKDLYNNLKK
jgi:hypothetical protein